MNLIIANKGGTMEEFIDSEVVDHYTKMTTQMYELLRNDCAKIKTMVNSTLIGTHTKPKTDPSFRIAHINTVANLSNQIMFDYIAFYKSCTYNHDTDKIRNEYIKNTLSIIDTCNLSWLPYMIALLHDMYKLIDAKDIPHGYLAAKQFEIYCESQDIRIKNYDLLKQAKIALAEHSNKARYLQTNIFFDILCDADIISKFTMNNIEEKMLLEGTSVNDTYENMIKKNASYTGKTPFYDIYKKKYSDWLELELRRYLIVGKRE